MRQLGIFRATATPGAALRRAPATGLRSSPHHFATPESPSLHAMPDFAAANPIAAPPMAHAGRFSFSRFRIAAIASDVHDLF